MPIKPVYYKPTEWDDGTALAESGAHVAMSTLTSHIPGMAEAMESVSDKLKVRFAAHVAVMLGGRI